MVMQMSSGQSSGEGPVKMLPAPRKRTAFSFNPLTMAIVIVAVIAVVIGAFVLMGIEGSAPVSSTSTVIATNTIQSGSSTSIQQVTVAALTGCSTISNPGTYTVNDKIKTAIASGACIDIVASNVRVSCGGNRIIGSAPSTPCRRLPTG